MTTKKQIDSTDRIIVSSVDSEGRGKKTSYTLEEIVGGWRDAKTSLDAAANSGANVPPLEAFGPSGDHIARNFDVNDVLYTAVHIEHDIKLPSTMYPHVHWSTNGTNTQPVVWEIKLTSALGHDQDNFGASQTFTVTQTPSGTAWRHMIAEDDTGLPAIETDSIILVRIKRLTNGGTDNTDKVFGLFFDLHYEAARYGSLNRAPNFYVDEEEHDS